MASTFLGITVVLGAHDALHILPHQLSPTARISPHLSPICSDSATGPGMCCALSAWNSFSFCFSRSQLKPLPCLHPPHSHLNYSSQSTSFPCEFTRCSVILRFQSLRRAQPNPETLQLLKKCWTWTFIPPNSAEYCEAGKEKSIYKTASIT